MATIAIDAASRHLVAEPTAGDSWDHVGWTVSPLGYAEVWSIGPSVALVRPLAPGVVAVTATFYDAPGNVLGSPAPVIVDVAIAGVGEDAMTIASSGGPTTGPQTFPQLALAQSQAAFAYAWVLPTG